MRLGLFATLALSAAIASGCSSTPQMTQAQMNQLETREVSAAFAETFNAASHALFDAGYTISMSDREAGLITGTKVKSRRAERRKAKDALIEDDRYALSIQVREVAANQCMVRLKTAVNGEPVINKRAIDKLWVLMQRQLLMKEPSPLANSSPTRP